MQSLAAIRSELVRLKWHVAASRFQVALRRHALALKAGFNPDQPRVPADNANGGQWTSGGAGGGGVSVRFPLAVGDDAGLGIFGEEGAFEDFYGYEDFIDFGELGVFDDDGLTDFSDARRRPPLPPIENPLAIPSIPPEARQHINQIAREVARSPYLTIYYFTTITEIAEHWLNELHWEIKANQDPPKTLGELYEAMSQPDKRGYDRHHIVEQTAARNQGFPDSRINGQDNLVLIPRYRHEQINSWYQRPNKEFDGLTPRQYLQGKSWDDHRRVGLDAMRLFGILKP
ncbi:hypothetical protein [Pseudorhodoplanes sinuspersici]|uniref:Uncharacterized protein n=1 Tax=Pseudorhodoplanes sinuspersici TaxID=1235591 RepID=A0A1W6ZU37_9HYPH|nr:hypothetical protein [Pseudorhodoplanes sinuspersici]ARQ00939.1 hypothetical protein CAK95_18975 [Pseudorhodoplanes sinuspersici]RKE72573.1 hypothetical protein DFP91_0441 [Pseudorhodoplanes sinuspersici]